MSWYQLAEDMVAPLTTNVCIACHATFSFTAIACVN